MTDYAEIAEKIRQADAFIIGASNGFSISEGIHIFADNEAFEGLFGDFKRKYGLRNILSGLLGTWPDEETKWAFLSRLIQAYCLEYTGSPNTDALKKLIGDRPYFFITSNGEHHFELAGFSPENIWEIEGNWSSMQCSCGCHDTLYPVFPEIRKLAAAERDGRVLSGLIPRCPRCGKPMELYSPQKHPSKADTEQRRRYQEFLHKWHGKRLVILELGIGWRNQLIKAPLMKLAAGEPEAAYIAVNKGEIYISEEIRAKAFGLDGDMTEILTHLVEANEMAGGKRA